MKWIEATRPKTLIISIVPVLIGTVFVPSVHWLIFAMTLICALSMQIGTNFANDYFDFKQGADTKARKGPRRLITTGHIKASAMCFAMIVAFFIAFASGVYLSFIGGWVIFILLILGILSGIGYSASKFSLSRIGLADLFVFIFFGPIAVIATYYLQTKAFEPGLILASLAPGLIPVAVLTANNLRDHKEDQKTGKHTFVVRFGKCFGQIEYTLCLIAGIGSAVPLAIQRLSLILPLFAIGPAIYLIYKIWTYQKSSELNHVLASTGKVLMLYTVLFLIGAML